MLKIAAVITTVSVLLVSALPATTDNKLEKTLSKDITINLVTPKDSDTEQAKTESVRVTSDGTSGYSEPTESNRPDFPLFPREPPKIEPPRNVIAKFIDDIFQIPIGVLQSVTRLLTNPFTQQKKDGDSY